MKRNHPAQLTAQYHASLKMLIGVVGLDGKTAKASFRTPQRLHRRMLLQL